MEKSKRKESWLVFKKEKGKKVLVSSAIITLLFIATLGSLQIFNGNVMEEGEVTWNAQKGDVYYLGFKDDYFYTDRDNNDDFIRKFRNVLKSEILDIKDVDVDWDDDDDLIIMSSWLFGSEDTYAVEFPNWFDLYQILMTVQNFQFLMDQFNDEIDAGIYQDVVKIYEWALPSAIHYQCSIVYYFLESLAEKYKLEKLGQAVDWYDFETFEDMMEMFGEIAMNEYSLMPLEDDFQDYTLGNLPSDTPYTFETNDAGDNFASIFNATDDFVLELYQNNAESNDYVRIIYDLWDYIAESSYADRLANLNDYIFLNDQFHFNFQYNESMMNEFEIKIKSDDFNIMGWDMQSESMDTFNGYNGIDYMINNSKLYYKIGDWIITDIIPDWRNELPAFRSSTSQEKGWHEISLTEPLQNGVEYQFNIALSGTHIDTDEYYGLPDIPIPTTQSYYHQMSVEKWNGTDFELLDSGVYPSYIDCPYDFRPDEVQNLDNPLDEDFLFRYENWTNLEFNLRSITSAVDSIISIDDLFLDGELYWKIGNERDLMINMMMSSIVLISFYHLLFYPNEFNWEVVKSIFQLLNELIEIVFGINYDLIAMYDSEDYLKIEFEQEKLDILLGSFGTIFYDLFNVSSDTLFIEGDTSVNYRLVFDKRVGMMNESIFTFVYHDLGITRELGMELIACAREISVEQVVWLIGITNITVAYAIYEDYYPALPPEEWTGMEQFTELQEQLIMIAIFGFVLVTVGSVASAFGLRKGGRMIKERINQRNKKSRIIESKQINQ